MKSALFGCFFLITHAHYALGKTVFYEFNITHRVVAPDCVSKKVVSVNGQYPAPNIEVQSGDRVVVKVCNKVFYGAAIHWHGLHMNGEQWMDGPAFGSQCPIRRGECFTYNFSTKGQVGTFWYHSHIGLSREALYGAIIVHPKTGDVEPFSKPAGDIVLLLNDWRHRYIRDLETNLLAFDAPDALLINGRGKPYDCSSYECKYVNNPKKCGICDPAGDLCNPLFNLNVTPGKTYRLRIVNVALFSELFFEIEGHNLTVVMADANYVKPVVTSELPILPGQTFDLLVTFNKKPRNYWVAANINQEGLIGLAVVKYIGSPVFNKKEPTTPFPLSVASTDPQFGSRLQWRFLNYKNVSNLKRKVDKYFALLLNFNLLSDGSTYMSINNQSYIHTNTPLLAADYFNLSKVFNEKNELKPLYTTPIDETALTPPEFAESILTVKKGEYIQIVVQNLAATGTAHPWHLHGNDFWVVGQGSGIYNPKKEAMYSKQYNLVNPHLRNTVTVYIGTYVVIRLVANNPGVWNMHCHLEPHMESGMNSYLRVVGEPGDIPPPPADLRKCGRLKRLNATAVRKWLV